MSTAAELKQKLQVSNARAAKAEVRLANTFGTVPDTCPFDGCRRYISAKAKAKNPVRAFQVHLKLHHKCKHCKTLVAAPKSVHARYCKDNPDLTESDNDGVKKEDGADRA